MSDADALAQAKDLASRSNLQITTARASTGAVVTFCVWRRVGARRTFVGQRGNERALLDLVKRAAGSVATAH